MDENEHEDCEEQLAERDATIADLETLVGKLREHIEEIDSKSKELYNLINTNL